MHWQTCLSGARKSTERCSNSSMAVVMWRWETCTGGEPIEIGILGSKECADDGVDSFKTGRYLGSEGEQVYETRMLNLPS